MTGMQMDPALMQKYMQNNTATNQNIKNSNKPITRKELFEMMEAQPTRPAMNWLGGNG